MEPTHTLRATLKDDILAWSPDGTQLAIAGSAKGARIVDAATGRKLHQFRVTGRPSDTRILHHAFASTGRHYAFSCLHAVYLADLRTGEIAHRFELPRGERALTVPHTFTRNGRALVLPDGDGVRLVALDGQTLQRVAIDNAGDCHGLLAAEDGRTVIYVGSAHRVSDRIVIIDLVEGTARSLAVPYTYVPGKSMFQLVPLRIEDGALVALHKTHGLIWLDLADGAMRRIVGWDALGARTVFNAWPWAVTAWGRWVAFIAEHSDDPDVNEWSVRWPDGSQLYLFDLEAQRGTLLPSIGGGGLSFDAGGRLARLTRAENDKGRAVRRIDVFEPA